MYCVKGVNEPTDKPHGREKQSGSGVGNTYFALHCMTFFFLLFFLMRKKNGTN
jgi:hypothetical protein